MKTVIISILVLCGVIFGSIYFNNHSEQKSLSTKVNSTENINTGNKVEKVSIPTFDFYLCGTFYPNKLLALREFMEETFPKFNFGEDKKKDILEVALALGNKEIIDYLTEQGIKSNSLAAAIALGKKDEVENYLKQGKISDKIIYQCDGECFLKEVEGKTEYSCREAPRRGKAIDSISNLYIAVANNQVEIAKLLLEYGEDVNDGIENMVEMDKEQVRSHRSALSAAVERGHKEMVQFLLENNAYITPTLLMFVKDEEYSTVWNENKDIKELILKYAGKEDPSKNPNKEGILYLL